MVAAGHTLYLYDPAGALVLERDSSGLVHVPGQPLNRSGTYTFAVIDRALTGTFGYRLSLTFDRCGVNEREPGDGAETIVPGQITGGHIGPADMDTYCLTANSNDVISVALLRTNGAGTPYLYLYDPEGRQVLAGGSTSGVRHDPGLRLDRSGGYTLVVVAGNLTDSYDYLLSLTFDRCGVNEREPEDGAETIVPGQVAGGQISPADMDTYCLTAAPMT
jgi:hypothetical protein